MMAKLFNYTVEQKDLFENILKDDNLMLNHVVIESDSFTEAFIIKIGHEK